MVFSELFSPSIYVILDSSRYFCARFSSVCIFTFCVSIYIVVFNLSFSICTSFRFCPPPMASNLTDALATTGVFPKVNSLAAAVLGDSKFDFRFAWRIGY
jgi:hypothetical protein